jgi:putative nucleotidyltransferase with HDIG domain
MAEKTTDAVIADRVEFAVRNLDYLSILPSVAARVFSHLFERQSSLANLADLVESDPVLTVRVLSLMAQHGLAAAGDKSPVRFALEKLPASDVREALLSTRVLPISQSDPGADSDKPLPRRHLVEHLLAVACCAEEIAELTPATVDPKMAYLAGLVHDIGKLALQEAMPKSFDRIAEQARLQRLSSLVAERRHLGLDHSTLGKRLAQKWKLPDQLAMAIWLHHSDTQTICRAMPQVVIAQVVQLADLTVRQCGIGRSGSYDSVDLAEPRFIAEAMGITSGQMARIKGRLAELVEHKRQLLGLDAPNAVDEYCGTLHGATIQLTRRSDKLAAENRQLQTASSHLGFVRDFLTSVEPGSLPVDVAENFAVRWQKFYQTGMVCVYLVPRPGSSVAQAVLVEALARAKPLLVELPKNYPAIPAEVTHEFRTLDAGEYLEWLFEQLDVEFDLAQTKLMPLLCGGRAVGAIVFEQRYPLDMEQFAEQFRASASVGGAVLDMANAFSAQQGFAEQFAQMVRSAEPEVIQERPEQAGSLHALAEMAAGAAHELNNPLSVISGRAQLLAENETDADRKRMLQQIRQGAAQVSGVVNDLMTFARPPSPRSDRTDIRNMIDEAVQLTSRKSGTEHINVQIQIADEIDTVFVDSAQIVSAIANVICNSLESYATAMGPVKITAEPDMSADSVRLQISDLGCGIDEQALSKATCPFFSSKPAGRKRGMGLAHARRFIELNKGSISIESQPGEGTTVTVVLPR